MATRSKQELTGTTEVKSGFHSLLPPFPPVPSGVAGHFTASCSGSERRRASIIVNQLVEPNRSGPFVISYSLFVIIPPFLLGGLVIFFSRLLCLPNGGSSIDLTAH